MKKLILIIFTTFIMFAAKEADSTINSSSQALSVSELQQGVLMENAVNVKTPGYRTIKIISYNDQKTGQKLVKRANFFGQGAIVITNRLFDLAIEGNGFFVLSDGNGKVYFTRDGRFQVNSKMQMVSLAGGLFVLDENDAVIEIPAGIEIKVDEKGYVYSSDNNVITRLKIIDVLNNNKLLTFNNVLFYLNPFNLEEVFVSDEYIVRQGSYESSNVDYNKLMVELADKSLYTANTQAIQTRLKMLDSLNGLVNQN